MFVRSIFACAVSALALTACATSEPVCRPADAAERAAFGAVVAHDQARLAQLMAQGPAAEQVRNLDPRIEAQVFGQRMGDAAVRTVLMQPPLCVVDGAASNGARISYVFPQARFEALQNVELEGLERGRPGLDHIACRYEETADGWRLSDACLSTFAAPAS
ncbi:hypothetical protein ACFELO_13505 [Oceanicaulis sp. LC35]|uniref:hypothetical protein n=1 Tax=Oceanicaulis sp. LC35 TaxID=3349635 RepID=UPI003F8296D8